MVPQVLNLGYTLTDDLSKASLIVVNTCGFLESAVEEAVQSILEASLHKEEGECECLVATGCMVQRYGRKLMALLPEVDLFIGTSHYQGLEEALRRWRKGDPQRLLMAAPRSLVIGDTPRVRSTHSSWAYIKIAEGCSNRCAFCMIPHLRGPFRSRTVEDVVGEAVRLAGEGVKEINLIGQDITAFGSDRGDALALVDLLESLDHVDGLEWVRLLYAYPARIDDKLLSTMASSKKVVPYLDIPIQHCAPGILDAMGREKSREGMDELIARIRRYIPSIALRTSIMVGFPGESEEDFRALLEFVERTGLDHMGVFAYSAEAGTRAARMPLQVPEEIKEERRHLLLELQRGISHRRLQSRLGLTLPVLIEGPHPETSLLLSGRLAFQAPEVDGGVIITSGEGRVGEIMKVRITATHDYDLEGELVSDPTV